MQKVIHYWQPVILPTTGTGPYLALSCFLSNYITQLCTFLERNYEVSYIQHKTPKTNIVIEENH